MLSRFRRPLVVAHDLTMVAAAWLGAFLVHQDFHSRALPGGATDLRLLAVLAIQGMALWWTGLYRAPWRFASLPDAGHILKAVLLGTLGISAALFLYDRLAGIPRTVVGLYPLLLVLLLSGPRLGYRFLRDRALGRSQGTDTTRVLALGAGSAGEMLARDLNRHAGHQLVGFLDDAPALQGARVRGRPVLGRVAELPTATAEVGADLVIIAMPSASNTEMQRVVEHCEASGLPFRTLPRTQDLVAGDAHFTDFQEVAIEDLLGRAPLALDTQAIGAGLGGRTILVSGGGGSIGAELCRQIAAYEPRRLVLAEVSEYHLYRIEQELTAAFPGLDLVPTLVDVRDAAAVDRLFAAHEPKAVFHAAAYKHVPLLEAQPWEAVRNNVFGTCNVARAAHGHGAEKFVLLSTDKAVNPTNIMGATKRLAELFCQSLDSGSATRFTVVRFGNVLDSAGSVVPAFRAQIARGGPVTVTHPRITRYFMTIPEASQIILQAEALGEGGEVLVLDMGEPVTIRYLAEQMIRMAGKRPGRDIPIHYTGLRPGEKLQEELFYEAEQLAPTTHQKILQARSGAMPGDRMHRFLDRLATACEAEEGDPRALVQELVPEYQPRAAQGTGGENVVPLHQSRG